MTFFFFVDVFFSPSFFSLLLAQSLEFNLPVWFFAHLAGFSPIFEEDPILFLGMIRHTLLPHIRNDLISDFSSNAVREKLS